MAEVTNNHDKTPIEVAGVRLLPGQTAEVADWDKFKDRQNIKYYLDEELLSVKAGSVKPAGDDGDKQALLDQLKALGIDAAANSKVETLRKKLDEAQKAAQERQAVTDELTALGVEFDQSENLEDLKAKLAEAKK